MYSKCEPTVSHSESQYKMFLFAFSPSNITSAVILLLWHFCRHTCWGAFEPWQWYVCCFLTTNQTYIIYKVTIYLNILLVVILGKSTLIYLDLGKCVHIHCNSTSSCLRNLRHLNIHQYIFCLQRHDMGTGQVSLSNTRQLRSSKFFSNHKAYSRYSVEMRKFAKKHIRYFVR